MAGILDHNSYVLFGSPAQRRLYILWAFRADYVTRDSYCRTRLVRARISCAPVPCELWPIRYRRIAADPGGILDVLLEAIAAVLIEVGTGVTDHAWVRELNELAGQCCVQRLPVLERWPFLGAWVLRSWSESTNEEATASTYCFRYTAILSDISYNVGA